MHAVKLLFWPAEQFGHVLPSPIGAANGVAENQVRSAATIVPGDFPKMPLNLTSTTGKGALCRASVAQQCAKPRPLGSKEDTSWNLGHAPKCGEDIMESLLAAGPAVPEAVRF